jgi:hypothetical protein
VTLQTNARNRHLKWSELPWRSDYEQTDAEDERYRLRTAIRDGTLQQPQSNGSSGTRSRSQN